MESFKEYLREVMAGPGMGDLNLSKSQKRVLRKVSAVAGGEAPEQETGELPPEDLAPEEQQEELDVGTEVPEAPPEEGPTPPAGEALPPEQSQGNSETGNLAAQAISNSHDSRNLINAVKMLAKYGYLETQPPELGPEDEPTSITLTDKGQKAIETHRIMQDQTLLTPEEQQQSAPSAPAPTDQMGMGGAAPPPPAGGMGGEIGGVEGELGGEEGTGEEELPPEGGEELGGEGEMGAEEELPPEETEPEAEEQGNLRGKGIKLELSSFFHDVNDLAKFIK